MACAAGEAVWANALTDQSVSSTAASDRNTNAIIISAPVVLWQTRKPAAEEWRAGRLTRIDVPPRTTGRRVGQIRKLGTVSSIVDIDPVAQPAANVGIEARERCRQHPSNDEAKCDIGDVVED